MRMNDKKEGDDNRVWYYVFLFGGFCVSGGIFLICEHYLMWGVLEFELVGHETFGVVTIIAGIVMMAKYIYSLL